jgi:peptide/nickel transport system permease protein
MRQVIIRLGRYTLVRAVFLILAVMIAIYLTVIVANMGGALDTIRINEIQQQVSMQIRTNPAYRQLPPDQVQTLVDGLVQTEVHRLGIDQPFFPKRSFQYLWRAMTLQLGWSEFQTSDTGSRQVRNIILERLPVTLLLFGIANMFLFFASLFIALFLSRRYGSFLDKATIALAPSSAAPGWFYGLFLILFFAAWLHWLPWGGLLDAPIPTTTLGYAASVLRHTILPAAAVVLSTFFVSIYSWRTFFLIYSSEDYVELARAKGLSSRSLEMRYVLRPTLPPIITNFVLVLITMWLGQIVLETVFQWPGLGRAFYEAIQLTDTPVIIGITVLFGYLLAATVFALDFVYAVVDPRVRIGAGARRT